MTKPPSSTVYRGRIQFMATCLADAFFARAAAATVRILEHAGFEVDFPPAQTCCGQPAFNAGDFASGRTVARHALRVFDSGLPVVTPSGSCAAMFRHGNLLLFENEAERTAVRDLAARSFELCDFLVNQAGFESWPGRLEAAIAIHHSCHTRGTGTGPAMERLLGSIEGVRLVRFDEEEQCCGFGGSFSVSYPHTSAGIGRTKLNCLEAAAPDWVVTGDAGCLMHLQGLARKENRPLPFRHVAEVLAESVGFDVE